LTKKQTTQPYDAGDKSQPAHYFKEVLPNRKLSMKNAAQLFCK